MMPVSPTRLELQRGLLVELGPEPRWWRIFARRRWRERQRAILAMDVSVLADYYARHYDGPMLEKLRGTRPIDFARLTRAKSDSVAKLIEPVTYGKPHATPGVSPVEGDGVQGARRRQ